MPIVVNLDVIMAKRKMSSGELAEKIGITPANLSILKNKNILVLNIDKPIIIVYNRFCQDKWRLDAA